VDGEDGEDDEEEEITKFEVSDEMGMLDACEVLCIILESSEKKFIEFCKGCVFNLEGNIKMNCV
jgi:hypothetical protein